MLNITSLNETEETLIIKGNFWVSFGERERWGGGREGEKIVEALEISSSLWNINMEKLIIFVFYSLSPPINRQIMKLNVRKS